MDLDGLDNLYEHSMDGDPMDGLVPSNAPACSDSLSIHPQRCDDSTWVYTVENEKFIRLKIGL